MLIARKSFIDLVTSSEGFLLFTNVVKIILALIKKKIGGATTFSIMTFSIMTDTQHKGLFTSLSIHDSQHE
jgi:hypothetical protein